MAPNDKRKLARKRKRATFGSPHPFRIYRTGRLADLFDVDPSTIWRWRRDGFLPPFAKIGGVEGLTGIQVEGRKANDEERTDDDDDGVARPRTHRPRTVGGNNAR